MRTGDAYRGCAQGMRTGDAYRGCVQGMRTGDAHRGCVQGMRTGDAYRGCVQGKRTGDAARLRTEARLGACRRWMQARLGGAGLDRIKWAAALDGGCCLQAV
jgi:hypothetical protein